MIIKVNDGKVLAHHLKKTDNQYVIFVQEKKVPINISCVHIVVWFNPFTLPIKILLKNLPINGCVLWWRWSFFFKKEANLSQINV